MSSVLVHTRYNDDHLQKEVTKKKVNFCDHFFFFFLVVVVWLSDGWASANNKVNSIILGNRSDGVVFSGLSLQQGDHYFNALYRMHAGITC